MSEPALQLVIKMLFEKDPSNYRINANSLKLKGIPDILLSFTCTKVINLSNNQINKLPIDIFIRAPNLVVLDLSVNKITDIPSIGLSKSKLRKLNLFQNAIKQLPIELGLVKQLQWLNVKLNPLTDNAYNEISCYNAADYIKRLYRQSRYPVSKGVDFDADRKQKLAQLKIDFKTYLIQSNFKKYENYISKDRVLLQKWRMSDKHVKLRKHKSAINVNTCPYICNQDCLLPTAKRLQKNTKRVIDLSEIKEDVKQICRSCEEIYLNSHPESNQYGLSSKSLFQIQEQWNKLYSLMLMIRKNKQYSR
ncbi:hypothetical protein GJ496_011287 [Pomphorhynchus laevis]|nr:hypothetical protein GJ496_011287 [Pomphorhynchus laevis]